MKIQQQDNAAGRGRPAGRAPRRRKDTSALIWTWHILELGLWMGEGTGRERQAYITVRPGGRGEFRLGPLEGYRGRMLKRRFPPPLHVKTHGSIR